MNAGRAERAPGLAKGAAERAPGPANGAAASFLLRSTRKRRPTVRRPLPDGSYLTTICAGKYRSGRGYGRLEVRIVEAWMTVTPADGTHRTELWRLMTSFLDADRYPAHELIRIAGDLVTAQPGPSSERVSLIVLLNAFADQIVAARGIAPTGPISLIGAIGRAAPASLLPPGQRWRLKARVRRRNSKYTFTTGKHPRSSQTYTLDFEMIKGGLDNANVG